MFQRESHRIYIYVNEGADRTIEVTFMYKYKIRLYKKSLYGVSCITVCMKVRECVYVVYVRTLFCISEFISLRVHVYICVCQISMFFLSLSLSHALFLSLSLHFSLSLTLSLLRSPLFLSLFSSLCPARVSLMLCSILIVRAYIRVFVYH